MMYVTCRYYNQTERTIPFSVEEYGEAYAECAKSDHFVKEVVVVILN